MALNSLLCADVPLRNYSHPLSPPHFEPVALIELRFKTDNVFNTMFL